MCVRSVLLRQFPDAPVAAPDERTRGWRGELALEPTHMKHRTVIRLVSAAFVAVLPLGCDDDEPTAPTGPFLEVTAPGFFGLLEGSTRQLEARSEEHTSELQSRLHL